MQKLFSNFRIRVSGYPDGKKFRRIRPRWPRSATAARSAPPIYRPKTGYPETRIRVSTGYPAIHPTGIVKAYHLCGGIVAAFLTLRAYILARDGFRNSKRSKSPENRSQ